MVWIEFNCCDYVRSRLAQNAPIDDIRIEGWPVLIYARKHKYEMLRKLMLEMNADPLIEESEGEGEEGEDPQKTGDEGEVGEVAEAADEEGDQDGKTQWNEIRCLQNQVTEIESVLHQRMTEVKTRLAVAKLEKSQVKETLEDQVFDLQTKLKGVKHYNARLHKEVAELKTEVGVVKFQKEKLEEKLLHESSLLKEQLQKVLLELEITSSNQPNVISLDEEKCTDSEAGAEQPSDMLYDEDLDQNAQGTYMQSQSKKYGNVFYTIEHNLSISIQPEPDVHTDSTLMNDPSNYKLAHIFSSKIEELKDLFNVKRDLVVANAQLKSELALQELDQKKKIEEVEAKNQELQKLITTANEKLRDNQVRNRKTRKILVFASAIVEKYLEVLAEHELNHCNGKTFAGYSCSMECLEKLYDDMKKTQESMQDVSDCKKKQEPVNVESKKNSVPDKNTSKNSSETGTLRQIREDFNVKMPQNFKPIEQEIEAVTNSFSAHHSD